MSKYIINKVREYLTLATFGGFIYVLIEILWRGYSHWTMFILGALCFILLGLINEILPWKTPIEFQALIGAAIITFLEFVTGCIVNLGLGWHIWDYSDLPMNILGQICIPFSLIWIVISFVAIVVDDIFRYKVFREEKPHYKSIILRKEFNWKW